MKTNGRVTRPKVTLLSCTSCMEEVVALAAGICYSPKEVDELMEDLTKQKIEKLINNLASMGHESPFEHASFTFAISDISRSCSHQLVRHRIASYSQRSQRYVNESGFSYVIPPEIENDPFAQTSFIYNMDRIAEEYDALTLLLLVKKINGGSVWGLSTSDFMDISARFKLTNPKQWSEYHKQACEDARYILPNACTTQLICTMNVRSLWNFFSLRCCNRAQWEIREVAELMLDICKDAAPNLFKNAGPKCLRGRCPEGEFGCGKSANVTEKYKLKG